MYIKKYQILLFTWTSRNINCYQMLLFIWTSGNIECYCLHEHQVILNAIVYMDINVYWTSSFTCLHGLLNVIVYMEIREYWMLLFTCTSRTIKCYCLHLHFVSRYDHPVLSHHAIICRVYQWPTYPRVTGSGSFDITVSWDSATQSQITGNSAVYSTGC